MKICIACDVWRRPWCFDLAAQSWRDAEKQSSYELEIVAVGSSSDEFFEDQKAVARKHGIAFYEFANQPLSDKCNYRSQCTKKHEWDYQVIMGSDDFVSPGFFAAYESAMRSSDLAFGFSDCHFFSYATGDLWHWAGYGPHRKANKSIGAGRLIHRSVFEAADAWELWDPGLPRNLDASFSNNLKKQGLDIRHEPCSEMLVDVKSKDSITKLEKFVEPLVWTQHPVWMAYLLHRVLDEWGGHPSLAWEHEKWA